MASNFRLFSRLGLLGAGSTALAHFTPFSGHGSSTNGGRSGTGPARCDGNFLDDEKDTAGFVGVFLDQASIDKVKQHGLLGGPAGASLGRTPHALVHLHPDPETRRSFAPLFGSKVTFPDVVCATRRLFSPHVKRGGASGKMGRA